MEHKNLPPFWVIFGVGIVIVASLGFVLASMAGSARVEKPQAPSVLATQMPLATSVPASAPTTAPAAGPASPLPTSALKAAPDFTLERSDGSGFTLSEQLVQGPVVLVFFQRCSS
jgi:cytochrome oxidase Cu insertion factor (SCO1/SenC/PrrC family)